MGIEGTARLGESLKSSLWSLWLHNGAIGFDLGDLVDG
jgi:hypothetical protein